MNKLIEIKDLKTYFYMMQGVVKAVDGISYHVNEAETIALVGESGCGKSVSALSILGLIRSPGKIIAGSVLFEGKDLLNSKKTELRHIRGNKITMVFQEPMISFNPVFTIGFQIQEVLKCHRNMDTEAAKDETARLLELVGIPDAERRMSDYPYQFSGGMCQRAMIAMAIACNPRLLIADEPTTALDVTTQAQLLEMMTEMTKRLGSSLIIITHNLGVVARYAQRVNVMYAGRIVESGTAEEVYHDPRHPYTLGLLASVPRLDEPRRRKLVPIAGVPPDLTQLPSICAFLPRCVYATDECREISWPNLRQVADSHYVACKCEVK
jgi:oligopeptide/dipeptide ABC transporter ATP-binding protein